MKSHYRFYLCFLCLLSCILVGCNVKRPKDVISESTMEDLLYDYHLAKAMGDNLSYDENYKKALYIDAVFKKYDVTEAAFDSSLVWYTRNTDKLAKIYENVGKRLKTQQDYVNHLVVLKDKKPKPTEAGDSIDVWPWRRSMRLSNELTENQYAFAIPTDSNFKDRDTLVWQVRYRFVDPQVKDPNRSVTMAMQAVYDKDTINHIMVVNKPGLHQIRLSADTLGALKEVKGFLYYSSPKDKKGMLLADNFKMTRYHCLDTMPFAKRDSLNKIKLYKADSLKKVKPAAGMNDTLNKTIIPQGDQRLTPEEMNRRRTVTPTKKPEQIEVEKRIQEEKEEQRKARIQNNQRRNQQRRQNQQ